MGAADPNQLANLLNNFRDLGNHIQLGKVDCEDPDICGHHGQDHCGHQQYLRSRGC